MTKEIFLNTQQKLDAFCSTLTKTGSIEKAAKEADSDFYFDAEYNGESFELGFKTREEVEKYLDEWWDQRCADDGISHKETREDTATIIKYNDDDEIVGHTEYNLFCEGYHGDYEEHNTMYRGGCL